jgi:hypothetical protein
MPTNANQNDRHCLHNGLNHQLYLRNIGLVAELF